jgi:hypothetical protein
MLESYKGTGADIYCPLLLRLASAISLMLPQDTSECRLYPCPNPSLGQSDQPNSTGPLTLSSKGNSLRDETFFLVVLFDARLCAR